MDSPSFRHAGLIDVYPLAPKGPGGRIEDRPNYGAIPMRKIFSRLNPHVQAVSGWLAVVGFIMSAAYTLLSRGVALFGELNWPEAILVGIGLSLVTGLLLSILLLLGAFGFRLIRPLPISPTAASDQSALDYAPEDELRVEMAALKKKIEQLDGKVETIAQLALKSSEGQSQIGELHRERMDRVEEDLKELRDKLGLVRHDMDKAEQAREAESEKAREATYAIYGREILTKLASDIEREASELYDGLRNGEVYSDARWDQWSLAHGRWESALNVWAENGQWYAPDVKARILTVDDAKFGGNWSVKDQQFPNSLAVQRFKKFRIMHTQWREVREEVDRGVVQVAFIGLTSREVRQRPQK